jgi:hypothetical protein
MLIRAKVPAFVQTDIGRDADHLCEWKNASANFDLSALGVEHDSAWPAMLTGADYCPASDEKGKSGSRSEQCAHDGALYELGNGIPEKEGPDQDEEPYAGKRMNVDPVPRDHEARR